jgi:proteasome lid subunit RPN8/RPN11
VLDEVAAHARESLPAECCGVLLGTAGEVIEAVRTCNLSEDPNRYHLDPKGHIDARRAARRRGLEVVGFYHSHPHSEPEPSATDVSEAAYPGHLHLIVRPLAEGAKVRVFRFEEGKFLEVGFVATR